MAFRRTNIRWSAPSAGGDDEKDFLVNPQFLVLFLLGLVLLLPARTSIMDPAMQGHLARVLRLDYYAAGPSNSFLDGVLQLAN